MLTRKCCCKAVVPGIALVWKYTFSGDYIYNRHILKDGTIVTPIPKSFYAYSGCAIMGFAADGSLIGSYDPKYYGGMKGRCIIKAKDIGASESWAEYGTVYNTPLNAFMSSDYPGVSLVEAPFMSTLAQICSYSSGWHPTYQYTYFFYKTGIADSEWSYFQIYPEVIGYGVSIQAGVCTGNILDLATHSADELGNHKYGHVRIKGYSSASYTATWDKDLLTGKIYTRPDGKALCVTINNGYLQTHYFDGSSWTKYQESSSAYHMTLAISKTGEWYAVKRTYHYGHYSNATVRWNPATTLWEDVSGTIPPASDDAWSILAFDTDGNYCIAELSSGVLRLRDHQGSTTIGNNVANFFLHSRLI